MIDKAFAAVVAALGLLMFLWPTAFMKPLDSQSRATRAANNRAIGLLAFVMGLIMFVARQRHR
jgi:hypothetical protein